MIAFITDIGRGPFYTSQVGSRLRRKVAFQNLGMFNTR